MFSPTHLAVLAPLIRERAAKILDDLPRGETFDFVDRVSIELTTQMLATLFDFPLGGTAQAAALVRRLDRAAQERRVKSPEQQRQVSCSSPPPISHLWNERVDLPPATI